MNNKAWIESLHGDRHKDVTLAEARAVVQMIKDGDLRHIDGDFITALADLAAGADAEYLGVTISRDGGHFTLRDGGEVARATDAIEALFMCEAHRDRRRKSPLREPEPPTFDEALATKCDAQAREDEARKLKGMV